MGVVDDRLDEARIIERTLLRIQAIDLAKSADEVTYRFGLATENSAAALDCEVLSTDRWVRLLILAEPI